MNPLDLQPPDQQELVDDLKLVRRRGLLNLGDLDTPALDQAARTAGRLDDLTVDVGPYVIEQLLREAVSTIGGDLGDAAAILFGLDEGGRSAPPPDLRKAAAANLSVSADYLRKTYEPRIFSATAQIILGLIHRHRLHLGRLRQEVRTPVGSRLAVEWLTRFEAMYSMWTPVSGVGNDLTAARSTLLDPERIWDREPDPSDPDDTGYSQELQAAGYVTFAFVHFTRFLCELENFQVRFGGLWLLPDSQAETDLADAVFRIKLASPNNERDDSYLRRMMNRVDQLEMTGFLDLAKDDPIAMASHDEWQVYGASCQCEWDIGARVGREAFPIHPNHPNIDPRCDVHLLIAACNDYILILDDAWDQIADWYHDVPKPVRIDLTGEEIYAAREYGRMRFGG